MTPQLLLDFWFAPEHQKLWFDSTPNFDETIRERFAHVWQGARQEGCPDWEKTAQGALALVILFDQMPLNMYRGLPESFSTEQQAREVASRAINTGFDQDLDNAGKMFLYLPYMHSEELADQDRSISLFKEAGLEQNLKFAHHHRNIVQRFGRFPHRNTILGRDSTNEEIEWLASGEAFLG